MLCVVQDEVAMRERSALRVLAGEPDRDPLHEQRRKRQSLRLPPVDGSLVQGLRPPVELAGELGMDGEPVGRLEELVVQRAQLLRGNGGDDFRRYLG